MDVVIDTIKVDGSFIVSTLTLFATVLVASWTVWYNGVLAKRRATVDLVISQRANDEFQKARKELMKLHNTGNSMGKWAADECEGTSERNAILEVLNHYEFIAAGIKTNAFDKKLYQIMQHSMTLKDWKALKGFVSDFRNKNENQKFFQEFEWLAKEFEANPLKKN